jgi:3-oxoacyl-[acyl-carrier protein] reductase
MNDRTRGKVVLVTGATGKLGGALVQALFDGGYRVAVAVRKPWQVDKLRDAYAGRQALVGLVPTQDGEAAAGFVKGCEDALGPIAALVSTAGVRAEAMVGGDPAGELASLLEANLLAGATLARAVVGRMRRRKQGRILFVGRADAATTCANETAAAAAQRGYVAGLAQELVGTGVDAAVLAVVRSQDPPLDLAVAAILQALAEPALTTPLLPLAE